MDEYEEKLKSAECPFNWKLCEIRDRRKASLIIERLCEKGEEILEPWLHLCRNLTLAYLYAEDGDDVKAVNILMECENLINSSEDIFLKKYKTAINLIYCASRAVLSSKSGCLTEVKRFAERIIPNSELPHDQLSAIYAVKAYIHLKFGVYGTKMAIPFAQEALKLNPDEAEWHFLMGKVLSQRRHLDRTHLPDDDELSHLQTAFNILKTPRVAIFLANAYNEKSQSLFIEGKKSGMGRFTSKNKIRDLSSKAVEYVRFALEENKHQCVDIITRCAFTLAHLPWPARDMDKAKSLVEEVLSRFPLNASANKLAGDLYLKSQPPLYDKALEHYQVAVSGGHVYSAELSIFNIEVQMGKKPDPEEFYSRMLNDYKEDNFKLKTLLHATEYYVFTERDIFKAAEYFLKAVKVNPTHYELTGRFVRCLNHEINFFEVLYNEARIVTENETCQDEKLGTLKSTIAEIKKHEPESSPLELDKIRREGNRGRVGYKKGKYGSRNKNSYVRTVSVKESQSIGNSDGTNNENRCRSPIATTECED